MSHDIGKGFIQIGDDRKRTTTKTIIPSGVDIERDVDTEGVSDYTSDKIVVAGGRISDVATIKALASEASKKIVDSGLRYHPDDASKVGAGINTVTKHIITGEISSAATDDGAVSSVTEHVITGDVADSATDDGALQAPSTPVEVTSGKLGPGASYVSPSWSYTIQQTDQYGIDEVDTFSIGDSGKDINLGTGSVGDIIIASVASYTSRSDEISDNVTNTSGVSVIKENFVTYENGTYPIGALVVVKLTTTGSWSFNITTTSLESQKCIAMRLEYSKY